MPSRTIHKNIESEVLIRVEHVSKKFCRSLKRSLWYGTKDIARALAPWIKHQTGVDSDGNYDPRFVPELRKDEFWALQDISFEVRRGECLGLIGHNGAGKSTLLKLLNGLNHPDTGRITLKGRVGALIELGAGFNPILSGRENIYNQAALLGFSKLETDAKFDEIVEFSELEAFLDMPLKNYSSGMKVKLGFAVAAQLEPDILIVDEVLAVGDVGFRFKCLNKMADLMNRCAVIFVSHSMPQIVRVCSDVMLLEYGKSIYQSDDVGQGIERYFSHFDNKAQVITGSREAVVLGVNASSGGQNVGLGETLSVKHGEGIEITTVVRLEPGIESARVHLVVWNMELLPILDIMGKDLSGCEFGVGREGVITLSVAIPQLFLGSGKYTISVVVNSADNKKIYCRHDSAVLITMDAPSFSGAYVLMSPQWREVNDIPGVNKNATV